MATLSCVPAKEVTHGNIIRAWQPASMVLPSNISSPAALTTTATRELSNMDRLYDLYAASLFYYKAGSSECSADGDGVEPASRLQAALQELLVHYPCAAGVLLQNEANDGRLELRYLAAAGDGRGLQSDESGKNCCYSFGVPFRVAHAAVTLADLGDLSLSHPAADVLHPPPPSADATSKAGRFVMAFQVTYFSCGGFCIGHLASHVYGDGHTVSTFIQNLCSIARGAGLANPPHLTQRNTPPLKARDPPSPSISLPYFASRRRGACASPPEWGIPECFKIPVQALQALRTQVSEACRTGHCSLSLALLAVLWSANARACSHAQKLQGDHVSRLGFPVNVRRRCVPGISENYVGNALVRCEVVATLEELCDMSVVEAVNRIQSAMAALDYAERLQSIVDFLELQSRDGLISSVIGLSMPLYVNLPFYDTDCGWGAPVYVGLSRKLPMNSCFVLGHSKSPTWNVLVVLPSLDEKACFKARMLDLLQELGP